MLTILSVFFTSLFISLISIPVIINVARLTGLYDEPDERKLHVHKTPTLGGVAIFASITISTTLWTPSQVFADLQFVLCSLIIMFLIGIKDDIFNIVAFKKLLIQILTAFILIHLADVRLTSMYGLFGIYELSVNYSYLISMISIVGIMNSFNFIDGINTLAGTTASISSVVFGLFFFSIGDISLAILSFSLLGACVGFLQYNRTPARIFMGDTGSLIIGTISAILAIRFIEHNRVHSLIIAAPVFAVATLAIPVLDTVRVVFVRILRRRSPMRPDRTHLHHILVDGGMSHIMATVFLTVLTLVSIMSVYLLPSLSLNLGSWESETYLLVIVIYYFFVIQVARYYHAKKC